VAELPDPLVEAAPVPTPAEALFAAKVQQIIDQVDLLSEQAIEQALQLLDATRERVLSILANAPADSYTARHMLQLRTQINAEVSTLVNRYSSTFPAILERAEELGWSVAEQPVSAVGLPVVAEIGSRNLLSVLSQYSADLITNLGNEARRKINGELAQSALGTQTPYEAMQKIAANIEGQPSVFTSVAGRAQAIYRTETNRMFSMASQQRMNQMASAIPGLKKRWVAVDDSRTRSTHYTVGDVFADSGLPTVVGVKENYIVGGFDAMFPRDPSLPPEEAINCRCHSVPEIDQATLGQLTGR
jgi:Phage Mu protein F like protein